MKEGLNFIIVSSEKWFNKFFVIINYFLMNSLNDFN